MDTPERTLTTEPNTEICDACSGTGIEEGREWDGHPCQACKGKGSIAERPICEGCDCEMDPDWCHCGDAIADHKGMSHNHSPVPMGCQCGREPPDPDGECYLGRESANALAEEQARIQRELKR